MTDKLLQDDVQQVALEQWNSFRQHFNNYLQGDGPTGAGAGAVANTPNILVPYEGRNVKVLSLEQNFHVKLEGINAPVLLTGTMIEPLYTTLFNAIGARRAMAAGAGDAQTGSGIR